MADPQLRFIAFDAIDDAGRPQRRQSYSIANLKISQLNAGSADVPSAIFHQIDILAQGFVGDARR